VACDLRDPQRGPPGKLKAAARRWAETRQGGSDELAEDLEAFGLGDQVKAKDNSSFAVLPENVITVSVFLELRNHWMAGASADGEARMVMDHGQIKSTLELMGVKRREWPELFNGLKVMESEAIAVLFGDQ
jgi:hypothetical protein